MVTLKGRTCVFAGATAGDGRECVKILCAAGMNVIMATHNQAAADSLIAEVEAMGAEGKCICVAQKTPGCPAESDAEVYKDIEAQFGSVDCIISNIGGNGPAADIEDVSIEEFRKNLDHLAGIGLEVLQTAIPFLKKSRAPRVIFMTTPEAEMGGTEDSFANDVAKGAVKSLALAAAARLAKYGITVNCISKGPIPRVEGNRPGDYDPASRLASVPLGRLGTSEDLGHALAFLLSEEASYITGEVLQLNGGLCLGR